MKKINTGFAVDPSPQQPFTTKSLDFLQDSNKQMIEIICLWIIRKEGYTYSTTVPYYISGYATGFTSEGTIFFNGELYIMEENYATLAYATIDTTPSFIDPLLFSDGVGRNVHNNRYLTFTNTLSGSLFSMADIVNVASINPPWINITIGSNWTIPATFTSFANVFQYKKNINNEVQFRGYAKCVSGAGSSTIFTLPIGVIPLYFKKFIAYNGNAVVTGYIDSTTGDVICDAPVTNGYISIEQFRFSLD
jgi:hypothetical protein